MLISKNRTQITTLGNNFINFFNIDYYIGDDLNE